MLLLSIGVFLSKSQFVMLSHSLFRASWLEESETDKWTATESCEVHWAADRCIDSQWNHRSPPYPALWQSHINKSRNKVIIREKCGSGTKWPFKSLKKSLTDKSSLIYDSLTFILLLADAVDSPFVSHSGSTPLSFTSLRLISWPKPAESNTQYSNTHTRMPEQQALLLAVIRRSMMNVQRGTTKIKG